MQRSLCGDLRIAVLAAAFALVLVTASVLPSSPASATTATCADYPVQGFAQLVLLADASDPNGLDGADDNGIACDDSPCPCLLEAVAEAIGDGDGASETPAPAVTAVIVPTVTSPVVVATAVPSPTGTAPGYGQITPPATGDGGLQ